MKHIDLFSGIGGFALAVDTVWPNSEHIFCDNDPFCQEVLKKHWPESEIYGDIRTITNTDIWASRSGDVAKSVKKEQFEFGADSTGILTGGFPCQPFSQAGRRKGTEDNRYLWPEMFRVIQLAKPTWVIAENVRGLVTWEQGMVLEQVCTDLESENYKVQPLIIPAVAVNAPHRRDRIWFIAHSINDRHGTEEQGKHATQGRVQEEQGTQHSTARESKRTINDGNSNAENPIGQRSGGGGESSRQVLGSESPETEITRSNSQSNDAHSERTGHERQEHQERPSTRHSGGAQWDRHWFEVATKLCGMDDGLPAKMDGLEFTKSRHRAERLKALGNAIVPQVAIEIMKAIKQQYGT